MCQEYVAEKHLPLDYFLYMPLQHVFVQQGRDPLLFIVEFLWVGQTECVQCTG